VCIDEFRYEIQEQTFRYSIPAYTGPFRALPEVSLQLMGRTFIVRTYRWNQVRGLWLHSETLSPESYVYKEIVCSLWWSFLFLIFIQVLECGRNKRRIQTETVPVSKAAGAQSFV